MPRLVIEGFVIRIFTDDHAPAHVHVFRDGAELRVYLRGPHPAEHVRGRMKASDRRRAIELVGEHRHELLEMWRTYHS